MPNPKKVRLFYFSLLGFLVTLFSFFFMQKIALVGLAMAFLGFLLGGIALQASLQRRFAPSLFFAVIAMLMSVGSVFSSPFAQGNGGMIATPSAHASAPVAP